MISNSVIGAIMAMLPPDCNHVVSGLREFQCKFFTEKGSVLVWPDAVCIFFYKITKYVPFKFSERNRASQLDFSFADAGNFPIPVSRAAFDADFLPYFEWIGFEYDYMMGFHFFHSMSIAGNVVYELYCGGGYLQALPY